MALILTPQSVTVSSTNVAASTESEWASGTAYTTSDVVKVSLESDGTTPRWPVVEYSALASTTGDYPPDSPTQWARIANANQDKMFDGQNNSRTVADTGENIEVSIIPAGRVRYLYLLGLRNVASVTVQEEVDATIEATHTADLLRSRNPVGWYSWLYDIEGIDRYYARSCRIPLSGYYQPTLNITLSSGSAEAECAQCLVGLGIPFGITAEGMSPEIKDWSYFEQDPDFGTTKYTRRQSTRRNRGTIWVDSTDFDRIYGLLESQIGDLAVYDFNNDDTDLDSARLYGKLDSASPGLAYGKTPIDYSVTGLE